MIFLKVGSLGMIILATFRDFPVIQDQKVGPKLATFSYFYIFSVLSWDVRQTVVCCVIVCMLLCVDICGGNQGQDVTSHRENNYTETFIRLTSSEYNNSPGLDWPVGWVNWSVQLHATKGFVGFQKRKSPNN